MLAVFNIVSRRPFVPAMAPLSSPLRAKSRPAGPRRRPPPTRRRIRHYGAYRTDYGLDKILTTFNNFNNALQRHMGKYVNQVCKNIIKDALRDELPFIAQEFKRLILPKPPAPRMRAPAAAAAAAASPAVVKNDKKKRKRKNHAKKRIFKPRASPPHAQEFLPSPSPSPRPPSPPLPSGPSDPSGPSGPSVPPLPNLPLGSNPAEELFAAFL